MPSDRSSGSASVYVTRSGRPPVRVEVRDDWLGPSVDRPSDDRRHSVRDASVGSVGSQRASQVRVSSARRTGSRRLEREFRDDMPVPVRSERHSGRRPSRGDRENSEDLFSGLESDGSDDARRDGGPGGRRGGFGGRAGNEWSDSDDFGQASAGSSNARSPRPRRTRAQGLSREDRSNLQNFASIAPFCGNKPVDDYDRFRKDFRDGLEMCTDPSGVLKKHALKKLLKGMALEVYRRMRQGSFSEIMGKMKELFGSREGSNMYKRELLAVEQRPGQTVAEFMSVLEDWGSSLVRAGKSSKEDAYHCIGRAFIKGLRNKALVTEISYYCEPTKEFWDYKMMKACVKSLPDDFGAVNPPRPQREIVSRKNLVCNFWATGKECPYEKKPGGCRMLHQQLGPSGPLEVRPVARQYETVRPVVPAQVPTVNIRRVEESPAPAPGPAGFYTQNTEPCMVELQFLWDGFPYEEPRSYEGDGGSKRNLMRADMALAKMKTGEVVKVDYAPPFLEYANENVVRGLFVVLGEVIGMARGENGEEIPLPARILQFVVVQTMPTCLLLGREAAATWGIQFVFQMPQTAEILEDQEVLKSKMVETLSQGPTGSMESTDTFRVAEKDAVTMEAEWISADLRRKVREKIKMINAKRDAISGWSQSMQMMVKELYEETHWNDRELGKMVTEEEI